jgi:uncharacterized membrane protein
MAISSRQEAQQRADDILVFQAELSRLEREGVLELNESQRQALASYHEAQLVSLASGFDIDRNTRSKQLSLGMRVASFIGAIALAASVFFLFYQFWGYLSTSVQVSALVGASLGTFLLTALVDRFDSSGYFTKLAALLAFACFALNISMLGQIFNITPSDKALLAWGAFALVLAYTYDLRLLLAAAILCLVAFVAARTGTLGGVYWLHFGERPENFFPAAIGLFVVAFLPGQNRFAGFASLYRVAASLTLFLPMLVLANWGSLSYLNLDRESIQHIYQVAGFLGTAALVWWGGRRQYPELVNTGTTLFVVFFYSKLYDWWWDAMPKYLFFLVMGLAAILLLLVFRRIRRAGL